MSGKVNQKNQLLPEMQIKSVIALYSNGQIQEALDSVETLTKDYPNEPLLYNISGVCYKAIGQLDAAVKSFKQALSIKPDYTEVNYNLGLTLQELGQLDAAVKCYERAISVNPDHAEAHNNLGVTLKELGQVDAAVKSYEKAIAIKPDYTEAHSNLGNAFKALGLAFMELGQVDDAVKFYEKALAIKPDSAEAYRNNGNVLFSLKRPDEALASYESAIALNPDLDWMFGALLFTKKHLCIWDDLPSRLNELTKKINNGEKVMDPFPILSQIDDPEIQRKAAEIYAYEKHPQSHILPKIGLYPKHKKIRIGYFSADFWDNPVSYLTAELYELHDREQFEIHAFSYGPDTKDEMNLRIKVGVDHFHDVRTMSHEDVALLSRSVEIDIAVDLGGYTQLARTGIFAMTVAPIQLSYIGYLGTMGASYYDYLVADHTIIPEEKPTIITRRKSPIYRIIKSMIQRNLCQRLF